MIKKLSYLLLSGVLSTLSGHAVAVNSSADYDAVPPTILSGATNTDPLVMLVLSNDHQLYVKAYTDYTDMDGNGTIDSSYVDTFDYYGYFDSKRCYSHDAAKFEPEDPAFGANDHHCPNAHWSGNFLNWATMTRMDVLRKVLFGGKRSTDDNDDVILERAMIPTDVHAFVKTYSDSPTNMLLYTPLSDTEVSMCNVTNGSGASETATEPPMLRVAYGTWAGWATNEEAQCLFRDERDGGIGVEPPAANRRLDLIVRVHSCVSGKEEENCKTYASGDSRPTGLLQKFGERDGSVIRFGMMTGSYAKNKSGGVLRRDISQIYNNSTASLNEISSANGSFINQDDDDKGIINTLSRFRISKYNFGTRKYDDCGSAGIASITEGDASSGCSVWGNPISEIYMEALRYFSGNTSPTAAFNADDSSYIPSLPQINTWTVPMDANNACANCSIVAISTGLNSFDTDQMANADDIPGISSAADVNAATNTVGSSANENINSNSYIVGESDASTNKQCSGKTVTNFSSAKGICPELPTIQGGYLMSGLSHHAHTTDLRTSLEGEQTVDTYSIALAESIPSFRIPVDGNFVTFAPHCEANSDGTADPSDGGWRACSLANVTIETLPTDLQSGSMLFHWEDSTWGNDYDMDGVERINWCVGDQCSPNIPDNEIKITASTPLARAGHKLLFGYTISGTGVGNDGVKRVVERDGNDNFNKLYPNTGTNYANTITYTANGTSASLLQNPLWYAAKYGSFNDTNDNDIPDVTAEWDARNNRTGAFSPDGIPDNFFQVTNPALLEEQLDLVFTRILGRTSAGTALAVQSTEANGSAAIVQALYDPLLQNPTGSTTWGGRLHSLFTDSQGYLREDGNANGELDNYATDNIVRIFYSDSLEETVVQRYASTADADANVTTIPVAALSELKPIWDARKQLSLLDPISIVNQRPYNTVINPTLNHGRHIMTSIDGSKRDFVTSTFTTSLFPRLNVATKPEADNIVDFIRGLEGISGFRSRTIDFDGDHALDVLRLGDIINSTPVISGKPTAAYDVIYGDTSYRDFATKYTDRRKMVYVGANDGMIHAFNGGFYRPKPLEPSKSAFFTSDVDGDAVAHPLGAEIWGYIPSSLLPHLKWLTEPAYPHVYYMDGEPSLFDVNIFDPSETHPNGWGTILVIGMRLGGGDLTYDHDNNVGTADVTTRSSYVVLDVTDPEVAPTLLAEITSPNLGFTTSKPTLHVRRVAGDGNDWLNPYRNDWHLIFGSGPNVLDTATSTQTASIFRYNLRTNLLDTVSTGESNSFVGNPKVIDWNSNYQDDIVYFGTVGGTNAVPNGKLKRAYWHPTSDASTVNTLLNTGQPFVSAPTTAIDSQGKQWVFAGSGRLFSSSDNGNLTQHSYYGIKETASVTPYTDTVAIGTLQEVTTVQVFTDGSVGDPGSLLPAGTDTFSKLAQVMQSAGGWYRHFTADGTDPSTRSLSEALLNRQLLLFTTYAPPVGNACVAEGISSLYSLFFKTGTAYPALGLGTDPAIVNGDGAPVTIDHIEIGRGIASRPTIVTNTTPPPPGPPSPPGPPPPNPPPSCPPGTVSAVVEDSTGAISRTCITPPGQTGGRQSWREVSF